MVVKHLFIYMTFLLLGCDPIFGPPSIKNEFDEDIEIDVIFSDGDTNHLVLPPCKGIALGGIGIKSKIKVPIQSVSVRKNKEIIHKLNVEQLRNLVERNKQHNGYSVWVIDAYGIRFETNQFSEKCTQERVTRDYENSRRAE